MSENKTENIVVITDDHDVESTHEMIEKVEKLKEEYLKLDEKDLVELYIEINSDFERFLKEQDELSAIRGVFSEKYDYTPEKWKDLNNRIKK